jgi:hypothetical protein
MFNLAKLPEVKSLSTALRTIQAEVGPTGTVIIKMDKTGHWVFGADQTEVEADSTWAVNPFSFVHGYIAWGDGEVLAEKMVSVSEPLPEMDDAPPSAKRGWEVQVGMSIKCLTGEDKGLEARYTTTSAGGKRGVQTLAVAIAEMVDKDPSKPVPVVLLKKEHYQHKSYGRIYTPLFDIQSWVSMDGDEPDHVEEKEPAEAAPARRRRSAT